MSFGWSAGDIAQAIEIIVKVAKAIDGATKEYRDTAAFLRRLSSTLEQLRQFNESQSDSSYRDYVVQQSLRLKDLVDKLVETIKPYQARFSQEEAKRFYKDLCLKIRWITSSKGAKGAKSLQKEIEDEMAQLHMFLLMSAFKTLEQGNREQLDHKLDPLNVRLESIQNQIGADNSSITQILMQLLHTQTAMFQMMQTVPQGFTQVQQQFSTLFSLYQDNSPARTGSAFMSEGGISRRDSALDLGEDTINLMATRDIKGSPSIHRNAEPYARYCSWDALDQNVLKLSRLIVDSKTANQFEDKYRDAESVLLWARGSSPTCPTSVFSAMVHEAAEKARISTVAHFCERGFDEEGRDIPRPRLLLEMVFSLIYQVVQQLPSNVELPPKTDFTSGRFNAVEGPVSPISSALSLLGDCIKLVSGPMIFVIDSFETLEYSSDIKHLEDLQLLLTTLEDGSAAVRRKNPLWQVKTLFVTAGRTAFLTHEIEHQDQIAIATSSMGNSGVFFAALMDMFLDIHEASL